MLNKLIHTLLAVGACFAGAYAASAPEATVVDYRPAPTDSTFTMLQWNIWQEGSVVPGGYEAIVDEIARLQPDFVTLSEVRNYNNVNFTARLCADLADRGLTYHSFRSYDTGLLSREPITDSLAVIRDKNIHGTVHRALTTVHGRPVALYTAHLDYLNAANYTARGYDGNTFQPAPLPASAEEILAVNTASTRDEGIARFIERARADRDSGCIVLIGGDFNEPSHLDWTEATASIFDHHGMVVPWTVTSLLDQAGYTDAYRSFYPDPQAYPGFTFPADNPHMEIGHLAWGPAADERDRIDFIFYNSEAPLRVVDAAIFGPVNSIIRAQRLPEISLDHFILPLDVWPTDHKGILVTFQLDPEN